MGLGGAGPIYFICIRRIFRLVAPESVGRHVVFCSDADCKKIVKPDHRIQDADCMSLSLTSRSRGLDENTEAKVLVLANGDGTASASCSIAGCCCCCDTRRTTSGQHLLPGPVNTWSADRTAYYAA